ncbi:MAG: hypothetical protein JWO72_272, partial [Caulobacteraceae bacterium]|nr:hypothetical protein [Caulobacteraceae bacterium]
MKMNRPLHLPALVQRRLDAAAREMLAGGPAFDFTR